MSNLTVIAQNAEDYLSDVMTCNASIQLVLPHVKRILGEGWQDKSDGGHFFAHKSTIASRAVNGTVETPMTVAAYMVRLAYSRWVSERSDVKSDNHTTRWFDPCGGAGVFPVEIFRFYFDQLGSRSASSLPSITVSEISELGLAVSFVNTVSAIDALGFNLSDYIKTGKLRFLLGDTLDKFHERNDFFSPPHKFDIAIGNPPYVRASRLSTSYKQKLKQNFPGVYCGNADLYTYFIAAGISNIDTDGILTYISPASFTRAKSGATLRNWLLNNTKLDSFIDLDETKVFEDADLHSSIYVFRKQNDSSRTIRYRHVKNQRELKSLIGGRTTLRTAIFDRPSKAGWAFHTSQSALAKYSRLFEPCVTMRELGINIYSGIRPGYSAAFVLNANEYEAFSHRAQDKWIKPLVLPSNINKWSGYKDLHYMIVIPKGSRSIDREIISHLSLYKDALAMRAEVKDKDQWYALRSCRYYDKMDRPKIGFPDLSALQRFSLIDNGVYVLDGAYFIDTDNLVLLGILNSSLARHFFVNRCSSVGNLKSKGRFRFKKEFVSNFPLPRDCLFDGHLQQSIASVVRLIIKDGETEDLVKELDQMVYELYRKS